MVDFQKIEWRFIKKKANLQVKFVIYNSDSTETNCYLSVVKLN